MKLNISETSLEAYQNNIEIFINREKQALDILSNYGDMTSNELFEYIKNTFPETYRHNTHARLSGLRDGGFVYEKSKKICNITGERVIVWGVVPEGQQLEYRKKALEKKLANAKKLVSKLENAILGLTNGR